MKGEDVGRDESPTRPATNGMTYGYYRPLHTKSPLPASRVPLGGGPGERSPPFLPLIN